MAASKFAKFLADNKIDPRRVRTASRQLERLRPEDRAKRLARRKAKKSEAKPAEGEKPAKPRSGRPATSRLLDAASAGKPISGPAKTRLLRAVNHLLSQKKKSATDLKSLF
jgi:sRNA-binding protein